MTPCEMDLADHVVLSRSFLTNSSTVIKKKKLQNSETNYQRYNPSKLFRITQMQNYNSKEKEHDNDITKHKTQDFTSSYKTPIKIKEKSNIYNETPEKSSTKFRINCSVKHNKLSGISKLTNVHKLKHKIYNKTPREYKSQYNFDSFAPQPIQTRYIRKIDLYQYNKNDQVEGKATECSPSPTRGFQYDLKKSVTHNLYNYTRMNQRGSSSNYKTYHARKRESEKNCNEAKIIPKTSIKLSLDVHGEQSSEAIIQLHSHISSTDNAKSDSFSFHNFSVKIPNKEDCSNYKTEYKRSCRRTRRERQKEFA